ncbi:ABC transporter permease [Oceanithermus desulfurans]|uniref:Sugar ABC transporter permease n=2 Tax=Oceanithermus desulfurans TaxID=227924 RepID=A0A511RJ49_9DEIN|nr:ABC transporter permease [Oceanithermus desulfurans]MBB6028935.1 ribose/xylose/arabinose/galactoside ABC-type transport system permease subunit [Oceanithermus desulfurans]GEM88992.1 sugar ABC transporter permease [Oceanithermus desulfurans NBRC 100063]
MKLNKSLLSSSEFIVFLGLLAVGAFFAFTSPVFLTKFNLLNILLQSSIQGIIAIGMTFVILTAGIDLSVGSVVALSGVLMALMLHGGVPVWAVILINLAFGVAVGVFHGFSITKIGMAPFIVTLATMVMARGLTMVFSDGKTIFDFPPAFEFFGAGQIGPISVAVIIFLLYALVAEVVLRSTVLGRNIYAVGSNIQAAALSGIRTHGVLYFVYIVSGVSCAIAGLVLTGRLGAAMPTAAMGYELDAIAAVIIGGASLMGGKGTIVGTIIGVLLIGVINNGMNLLNVPPFWQSFLKGAVIFLAVMIDSLKNRPSEV